MNLCVAGACGRMGRRILELAAASDDITIVGALEAASFAGTEILCGGESGKALRLTVTDDAEVALKEAQVLIDFSTPEACIRNVQFAAERKIAAVVGTTGIPEAGHQTLKSCAKRIPIVFAPNMSVGMNLLFKLVKEAAAVLGLDYNVEIVEIHHNQKKDSPSGSAIRLAENAAAALGLSYTENCVHGRQGIVGARPKKELGMHAVRGGDVTGDHTVLFLGKGERLELTHRAHSRDTFASGALRAARFVLTATPGLYDMQDVLGLR